MNLQERMVEIEGRHRRIVPDDVFLVARLDGRAFHQLTRSLDLKRPLDTGFRDRMTATARHVMNSGFNICYAYTQSDEISVLFDPASVPFARRCSKLISVLAGEASASISLGLGAPASLDCRLLELANSSEVADYFIWRQQDAERNCLNGYAYWALRGKGMNAGEATSRLDGMSRGQTKDLLREINGIEYGALAVWERRGAGLYYERYEKTGYDPIRRKKVTAERRRIKVDLDLPYGVEHGQLALAQIPAFWSRRSGSTGIDGWIDPGNRTAGPSRPENSRAERREGMA